MKIVVTSSGDGLGSPVDPRFGRAARLVLIDTDRNTVQGFDNTQNMQLAQGAGLQAAATVANLGADCLITGNCGPKAFQALQAAGVTVVTGASGTVKGALDDYRAGRLQPARAANVEGHW